MKNHKILFLVMICVLSISLTAFADEVCCGEEHNHEIVLKTNFNLVGDNGDIIQPMYVPIHLCHEGPEHRVCEYRSGYFEDHCSDCIHQLAYCCCGKHISTTYIPCEKHRPIMGGN